MPDPTPDMPSADQTARPEALARMLGALDSLQPATREVYFIADGEVAIVQPATATETQKTIATLPGGDFLGEVALIDGQPRTMSAQASGPVTLVEIAPDALADRPGGPQALADLKAFLGLTVVQRIRTLNTRHVETLERELAASRVQRQFGQFFVYIVAILCSGMIVTNVVATGVLDIDMQGEGFFLAYSALLGVPSVLVLWFMRLPRAHLGLTTQGLRRSVIEGLWMSALAVAAIVLGARLAAANGFALDPVPFNPVGAMFYFLHSFLQEVLGRGVMQNSLRRFLDDRQGWISVILSSVLFGTMHVHLGIGAVLMTFAASLLFGAIFLRHNNLAGVTLIHFFAGAAAFLVGLI